MTRQDFAERLSAGLAGWFQQLAAQNLEMQVGEDAARVELVRLISAQQAYTPETSLRPTNWPQSTKKRIDVAVLGRNKGQSGGWYGAIELKWPKESIDVKAVRHAIVSDAVRVAFASTSNLNASFLIVGGAAKAIENIFEKRHSNADVENQRTQFNALLSTDMSSPAGKISNLDLNNHFPDFGDRVPQVAFNGWSRRLSANLIAVSTAKVGSRSKGAVYIWQIGR
jgi:hypothetical protein